MSKGRVTVFEGNERIRDLLQLQLQSAGFSVSAHSSLPKTVPTKPIPDLIIMNPKLEPGHVGAFCQRLRQNRTLKRVPVLILTSMGDARYSIQALKSGANDYVLMPWYVEDLMLRVSNLISITRKRHTKRPTRSAFLIYGKPDEPFAVRLKNELKSRRVRTFLFCTDAIPGKRLHRVMHDGVNGHDRVILLCSQNSLNRLGVLNEIEETLEREAREGGVSVLIPIALDDFVFRWRPKRRDLAKAIRGRVVADFSTAPFDDGALRAGVSLLMKALRSR